MHVRPRSVIFPVLIGTTLLVAGCGGGTEKPRTLAPIASAASDPPTVTTNGGADLGAAAEQFVRVLYTHITQAINTGDTRAFRADISNSCACRALADYIDSAYRTGRLRGSYLVESANAQGVVRGSVTEVLVTYSNPQGAKLDKAGRVLATVPAVAHRQAVVALVLADHRWHVTNMQVLPE